jgi:uncharacterized protein (DUF1330 family)
MWGVNWAQIVGTMGSAVAVSTIGREAAADQGRSPRRSPRRDGHVGAGQSSTGQRQPASDREAERRAARAMGDESAEPGRRGRMSVYVVVNLDVHDRKRFIAYRRRVSDVIRKYGGRYLVRAGELRALEGGKGMSCLIIIEFPSMEDAMRCYESEDYAPLLRMRMEAAKSDVLLVRGCDDAA